MSAAPQERKKPKRFSRGEKRHDFDTPWKRAVHKFFRPFMELCFLPMAKKVDWKVPPKFLETEIQKILPHAEKGKQHADLLVEVRLLDGNPELMLFHLELQSTVEALFEQRVFFYLSSFMMLYQKPVVSLVVLMDDHPNWKPQVFSKKMSDFSLRMEFPICKLLDFNIQELESINNPIALVIAAHLYAQKTRKKAQSRYAFKKRLAVLIAEKKWARKTITEVLVLIDWLLILPQNLIEEYRKFIHQLAKEHKMPHLTSWEELALEEGREEGLQKGLQKGREEGLQKGLREAIEEILEARFGAVEPGVQKKLNAIRQEKVLRKLLHQLIVSNGPLAAFKKVLQRCST